MNSGKGTVGIVLAVTSPLRHRLVAFNISAPVSKAAAIRPILPTLLKNLTINGVSYDGGDLSRLPDPLDFPQRNPDVLKVSP